MLILLYILIVIVFQYTPTTSSSIPIDIAVPSRYYFITISTEFPKQKLHEGINTYLPYTRISTANYNPTKSKNAKQIATESLTIENRTYADIPIIKDTLRLNTDTQLSSFYFYYSNAVTHSWNDGFGFAFTFNDYKYSIVHQLYNEGTISKCAFTLSPFECHFGRIYIGEPPQSVINNKDILYKGMCKSSKHLIPWNCKLNSIYSSYKGAYSVNTYVEFSTNQYYMILSKRFYDIITECYLYGYLMQGTCRKEKDAYKERIYCQNEIMKNNDLVYFGFEEMDVAIPLREMFECGNNEECEGVFAGDLINGDKFEIGGMFFKRFTATVFNYDYQRVEFYSKDYVINQSVSFNGDDAEQKMKLYIAIISMCLTGIIVMGYKMKVGINEKYNDI